MQSNVKRIFRSGLIINFILTSLNIFTKFHSLIMLLFSSFGYFMNLLLIFSKGLDGNVLFIDFVRISFCQRVPISFRLQNIKKTLDCFRMMKSNLLCWMRTLLSAYIVVAATYKINQFIYSVYIE